MALTDKGKLYTWGLGKLPLFFEMESIPQLHDSIIPKKVKILESMANNEDKLKILSKDILNSKLYVKFVKIIANFSH